MAKILLVEVDETTSSRLSRSLTPAHQLFSSTSAESGPLLQFPFEKFDLLILDCCRIGKIDPFIFCQRYRAMGGQAPILAIIDTHDPEEEAGLLDAGAQECALRGVQFAELSTRISALLRRPGSPTNNVVRFRDVVIDCNDCRVSRFGQDIPLTPKEFNILMLLVRSPNKAFTPQNILDRLWESSSSSSVDTVRNHVRTLRQKLRDNDHRHPLIRSIRGWGYRVVPD